MEKVNLVHASVPVADENRDVREALMSKLLGRKDTRKVEPPKGDPIGARVDALINSSAPATDITETKEPAKAVPAPQNSLLGLLQETLQKQGNMVESRIEENNDIRQQAMKMSNPEDTKKFLESWMK